MVTKKQISEARKRAKQRFGNKVIKVRGLTTTYAVSKGGGKFVMWDFFWKEPVQVTKPITRKQAKKSLGMTIPKRRRKK